MAPDARPASAHPAGVPPSGAHKLRAAAGGLLAAGIGAAALVLNQEYPMGTPSNMGPGFFPAVLGGLLCLMGLVNVGLAFSPRQSEDGEQAGFGRGMMLPLAVLLFGLLVERAGVVVATLALVACVCLAGYGFRWWEMLLLAVILVGIACALFVYGLQLPVAYLLPS